MTPGYSPTMGIPLERGRDFAESGAGAGDVAILNEAFAAMLFPGQDAVGRTLTTDDRVVKIIWRGAKRKIPVARRAAAEFHLCPVRAAVHGPHEPAREDHDGCGDVGGVADPKDRAGSGCEAADPPTADDRRADGHVAVSAAGGGLRVRRARDRCAASGAAGDLRRDGVQRVAAGTRTIGVRVALGAQRSHVLGLVLRQGVVLAAIGVVVGSLAAFGATRLIASLLYGVAPTDVSRSAGGRRTWPGGGGGELDSGAAGREGRPNRRAQERIAGVDKELSEPNRLDHRTF